MADPTYARIRRAIPKGVDPALADDAASDAYLAQLEKKCEAAKLEQGVKRIVSRNFARFANPWGAISLDAPRGADTDDTLMETVEDPRALEAFDEMNL
jgi:hypothetical protein